MVRWNFESLLHIYPASFDIIRYNGVTAAVSGAMVDRDTGFPFVFESELDSLTITK
jgi:hypothetical protein